MSRTLTDYKGYNTVVKGIVVNDQDPEGLNRVQVRIPSYHGDKDFSDENGESGLPWAQMCSVTTKSGGIFGGKSESVIPAIDDVVWLIFEGGDIRCPVVIGTIPKEAAESASEDGSDMYVAGGALADVATNIIMKQEGTYDSINPDDNGAISIGKIQWHANRAKNLLKDIQAKNKKQFTSKSSGTSLVSDLNKDWGRYVVSSGAAVYKAIKAILGTKESKEAQDELVKKDVSKYIEHGKKLGITDNDALIYFADYENQNGSGGASSMLKKCKKPYTLDHIHAVAKSNYTSRRNRVYAAIKKLKKEGKLNGTNGDLTNVTGTSGSANAKFIFPVYSASTGKAWRTLSAGYPRYSSGRTHTGIDFSCPSGSKVVAAMSGKVRRCKRLNYSYGHYVEIENGDLRVLTCHMSYIPDSIKPGITVKQGDVLGKSGNTGNSTGPHCHFEVQVNGQHVNPAPYLGVKSVSEAGNI